jgi:predicted glycoside hydrolase/deacetylase ChbG (UPF0249 family)
MNRGILSAFREGILSSTTMLVNLGPLEPQRASALLSARDSQMIVARVTAFIFNEATNWALLAQVLPG